MRQAVKAEKPGWGGVCQLYSLGSIEIKKWGLHSSENGGGRGTLYQRLSSVPTAADEHCDRALHKGAGVNEPPSCGDLPQCGGNLPGEPAAAGCQPR